MLKDNKTTIYRSRKTISIVRIYIIRSKRDRKRIRTRTYNTYRA